MESRGQRLKKIRLEKGLSLEDIHKKTKIHFSILKAIEEDALIGFNPVYIRGFLKIYCQFLGVNPQDFIGIGEESQDPLKQLKQEEKKDNRIFGFASFPQINIKIIAAILALIFSLVILFSLVRLISRKFSLQAKRPPLGIALSQKLTKKKISSLKIKDKEVIPAVPVKGGPKETPAAKNYALAGPQIRLGMRAKEDCWLDLKVDGRVVFHGILKKAKFESWQAKQKIEFSLGNAGVIELELNSRPIPPLGRKGQALKGVLITKEQGLVVPR